VRVILAGFLIVILVSCPILCGTAEVALGLKHGAATHLHDSGKGDRPGSHPVNDDDCICNGALKACAAVIGGAAHGLVAWSTTPGPLFAFSLLPTSAPTTRADRLIDPGDQPTAAALRARLQNFRC
jgi:hypothetical protein